jgi:hypothetical protein
MKRTVAFTTLYHYANIYIEHNIHTVNQSPPHIFVESLSIVLVCEILATECENVRGFYRLVVLLQCFVSNF